MSGDVWITVTVLIVGTAAIRAAGPVLVGARALPERLQGVISLVAPALLAALVVVGTVAVPAGGALELDARIAGVGVAGIVLAVGATTLPAGILAALVTALLRLLG